MVSPLFLCPDVAFRRTSSNLRVTLFRDKYTLSFSKRAPAAVLRITLFRDKYTLVSRFLCLSCV